MSLNILIKVVYRIFAATLKRVKRSNRIDYDQLLECLKELIEKPFVKAHDDFSLENAHAILDDVLKAEKVDALFKSNI